MTPTDAIAAAQAKAGAHRQLIADAEELKAHHDGGRKMHGHMSDARRSLDDAVEDMMTYRSRWSDVRARATALGGLPLAPPETVAALPGPDKPVLDVAIRVLERRTDLPPSSRRTLQALRELRAAL